jgi:hypothetical protein
LYRRKLLVVEITSSQPSLQTNNVDELFSIVDQIALVESQVSASFVPKNASANHNLKPATGPPSVYSNIAPV